jgi:hypothetical protein
MTTTTFGYIKAWAKNTLKTFTEEYEFDSGIMMSGNVQLNAAQSQELIEYLSDPANHTQYGVKLDFVLFYDESKSVAIGGKITTPYVKGEGESTAKASYKAKRKV